MAIYRAPSDREVKEAVRRIPNLQLRRAFFEGLKNPLWVEPLAREGVFDHPPEPEKTSDGLVRDFYWPEIDYLIRAAPDVPEAVVDVLLNFRKSNNAWVRRGAFSIGASVSSDQAARLQPLIKSWQSSGFGWRTDPRDLVSYAVNLLQGGQREVGRWFANLIFKPSAPQNRRNPGLALEDHWFREGLPRVVAALGADGLELVLSWLVAYERLSGHLTKGSDLTYFSRDSIRQHVDSLDQVEDVLIDAVRDLGVERMLLDPVATKDLLLQSNMLLGRKIALFSLSQALSGLGEEDERLSGLLDAATGLLFDDASGHESCRIDFAELVRAVTQRMKEPLDELTRFIGSGPRVDDDRLRSSLGGDASDDAEVDERVRGYIDRWKHRWLAAIGARALPAQLHTELAELDIRYGVIETPLQPITRVTSWMGPSSPVSQEEMASMTPPELVTHLESWHDSGQGWGPEPTHEGQGRELTALLTTNPKALLGVDSLINRLRPIYLRAILQGWEAALKADLELDWSQVADLAGGVLAHGDETTFPPEGRQWDDDVDFRPVKQAAVGLLDELAQKRKAPTIPGDAMARFAEMLTTLAADETAWSDYIGYDKATEMDALTTSLNWQWPIRIRGLIHLLSHGKDTAWYGPARSALEAELGRSDTRGASRAVLGEALGRLVDADPEWITPKIPELFGSGAELSVAQQIALTTAMAVHRYHPTLYELLTSSMIAAIDAQEPIVAGWKSHADPIQRIGEWVIDALIVGLKTIDDPVAHKFFSDAAAEVRGEAIGHIAWAFMHADVVDDEIRDRFAELWDQRVLHVRAHPDDQDELKGFHWFVKSKKFGAEWWIPRLREALQLNPSLSTEGYMIGKEIATSADVDPRGALEVLKLILEGTDEAGMSAYDLTRNAVPMVIARAIESNDSALKQDAVAYMNHLGAKGSLSLEDEVNKVLNGTIAQSDIDA